MTARTAYDAVAGTTLTATNLDKYPGGWIGYVEVTASQTGITSATDLTGLTETVTVGTSRRIRVSARGRVEQNSATGLVEMRIQEGGTQLATWTHTLEAGYFGTATPSVVLTPSSGSHTYKLTLVTTGGNVDLEAASTFPAYLLIEDIGPSS